MEQKSQTKFLPWPGFETPNFTIGSPAQLRKSQLSKSQLSKSQLRKSQLSKSQLSKSQLSKSQLNKSQLRKSQLSKSQLSKSPTVALSYGQVHFLALEGGQSFKIQLYCITFHRIVLYWIEILTRQTKHSGCHWR